MRRLGGSLLFFGIGSSILHLVGFEFILLMWIDMWGETTGWIIRGAMVALGLLLCLVKDE